MTAAKAGSRARFGLTLGLVVALAVVGNAATNLVIPAPLYVPTALLLALLAVLVAVRVGGCSACDLGLDREQLGHGLRLGAAAAAVLALVLAVGAALPATRDLFADRRVDQQSVTLLLYHTLVRIPLGTVVLEEILFRGVLLGLALRLVLAAPVGRQPCRPRHAPPGEQRPRLPHRLDRSALDTLS